MYQQYFSRKKSHTHRGVERGVPVLDFCCGTAPIALACLFLNQAHCVINDRDESIWVDVEARLRALVYTLMQSEKWTTCYARPGYPVHSRHNGNDFYKLFRCALGQVNAEHHIVFPPNNIPTKCTAAEYADLNGCRVQDDPDPRGVFCTQTPFLPEGTELPLFGDFKINKFHSLGEIHNLHTIELRATKGKSSKPIFIRISDQCPWKLVRCDKDPEQCNCTLVENTSVSFWEHNRACLQLTHNVPAGEELVCHSFEPAGGTVRLGLGLGDKKTKKSRLSNKKSTSSKQGEEDDEEGAPEGDGEEEDEVVELDLSDDDEVEVIEKKRKEDETADRAMRASKRRGGATAPLAGNPEPPKKKRRTLVRHPHTPEEDGPLDTMFRNAASSSSSSSSSSADIAAAQQETTKQVIAVITAESTTEEPVASASSSVNAPVD